MTYIGKKPENITASVDAPSGTFSGEVDAGSLDISGNADIDGTLEADAITINGTAIASVLSPIAGSSSIVTTGALNAGTITSGFGAINNGTSTFNPPINRLYLLLRVFFATELPRRRYAAWTVVCLQ